MANYLIDQMTWSYSRLTAYETCPYKFYLHYIEQLEEAPMFLSGYGSFVHELLAGFYSGQLTREEATVAYLSGFRDKVRGRPPSRAVFNSYFTQGLQAMKRLEYPPGLSILGVERRVRFSIEGYPFVGVIDLLAEDADGSPVIVDHKSKMLKPRSKRSKPTKTDLELDKYLRQLYLYAIPIFEESRKYPAMLAFNCFRSSVIKAPFCLPQYEAARRWAVDTIHKIENERDWLPNADPFVCNNICGLRRECVYGQLL